jgi:hypothetical protein
MAITFSSLPTATASVGVVYGPSSFVATGGTGPYTYAVTGGIVPPGMALSAAGVLSGTPSIGNVFTFQVTATDSLAATGFVNFSLVVSGGAIPPQGNPLAFHSFDYFHDYISTRDNAPPGQGAWTNPITVFDGTFGGSPLQEANAISCGALNKTEPKNILAFDGNNALAYLADGLPTAPVEILFPGTGSRINNSPQQGASFNIHYGEFLVGGALWKAVIDNSSNSPIIIKTVGGVGTVSDAAHAPNNHQNPIALQRVDNRLYFFLAQAGTNFAIYPFNMATGLWEPSFAPINLSDFSSLHFEDLWTNGLYKFPNGDFLVLYNTAAQPALRMWTAATNAWSAAVLLTGNSYANSVIDPTLALVHIFKYNSGALNSGDVGYSTFTHAGAALADNLATIPAGISGGDGLNHPSIQNNKLFAPYDDASDNTNAVWVGQLPAPATFAKEFLPRPIGEDKTIATWQATFPISISGPGAGGGTAYAPFDTGTVDGGIADYLAEYIVTGIENGIISGDAIHTPGTGYHVNDALLAAQGGAHTIFNVDSIGGGGQILTMHIISYGQGHSVANNVPLTYGGTGVGATVDITSIINGVVSTVSISPFTGGGYSVGAKTTTPAGPQPGVGNGMLLTILTVLPKGPSCAYMMFPNGYSIANPLPPGPPAPPFPPSPAPFNNPQGGILIYPVNYRELDTAAQIAAAAPIHASYTGRLIATDHTRKWTRWNVPAVGAALMYRQPGKLEPIFYFGGNVYALRADLLTDDDLGLIVPYYTTYFFVTHDAEMGLMYQDASGERQPLGSGRKLLAYLKAYVAAQDAQAPGTCQIVITPFVDNLQNPWALIGLRTLTNKPKFDLEWPGGMAVGDRIALQFWSTPITGTDNGFSLQRLTAFLKRAQRLQVRGSST